MLSDTSIQPQQNLDKTNVEPIEQSDDGDESISIPKNIVGAYLTCEEYQSATEMLPEAKVRCALRNQDTNNKVDLDNQFANYNWSYRLAGGNNFEVTVAELVASPEWHVSFTIKSLDLIDFQKQLNVIQFIFQATDKMGIARQESSTVKIQPIQWFALNGNHIPSQAAVGGTEHDGLDFLFLCRIYANGEILPGKLIVHFDDPDKSICYSIGSEGALQSLSDDAQTLLFETDVLLIKLGSFDEYFEWVPAENGQIPANAFIAGLDMQGAPIYSCRGLQEAENLPEQTPGALRTNATGCLHEHYGAQLRTSYQVLSWKKSAFDFIESP